MNRDLGMLGGKAKEAMVNYLQVSIEVRFREMVVGVGV